MSTAASLPTCVEEADPARTLFIICSKTFTTLETQTNARVARSWIQQRLGDKAVPQHLPPSRSMPRAMDEFGVHPDYRFAMWDWVGGRYSIWSAIGVSLAVAIGRAGFESFLIGGREIDEHFRAAPWNENLPVSPACSAVWNIDLLGLPTLARAAVRLAARAPAGLSAAAGNGEQRQARQTRRQPDDAATCAVIWGEPGNNAQHSFFQLLHQGTQRAALDFLLPIISSCGSQPQQNLAIANCLAQAEALALGQEAAAVQGRPDARQKCPRRASPS